MSDERELRSIVMEGPMPPADAPAVLDPEVDAGISAMFRDESAWTPRMDQQYVQDDPRSGDYGGEESSLGDPQSVRSTVAELSRSSQLEALQQSLLADRHTGNFADSHAVVSDEDMNAVEQLVRGLHALGLIHQTIVGVLTGSVACINVACDASWTHNQAEPQLPHDGDMIQNMRRLAGSPAALTYVRRYMSTFDQAPVGASERQMEIHARSHNFSDVMLNRRQMADVNRWSREELDQQTVRDVLNNGHTEPVVQSAPRVADTAIAVAVDLLYDYIWHQLVVNAGCDPIQSSITFNGMVWPVRFNRQLAGIFGPYHVSCRATWTANVIGMRRQNMHLEFFVIDPAARDVQGRTICGGLLTNPAILLVYDNGRFDFANFGQYPVGPHAQAAGSSGDGEDDIRGRDGGSSSHTANGDPARRNRALDLDL